MPGPLSVRPDPARDTLADMTNTPDQPAVPGDPEQPSIPDATPAAPGYQAPGLADPRQAASYPPPATAPYGAPAQAPYGAAYGVPAYAPEPPVNALAIIALILSLISVSIGGVICGHISLSQIRRTGERGHGMALAGLIIGYVGCAAWILFWIVWLVLIFTVTAVPYAIRMN